MTSLTAKALKRGKAISIEKFGFGVARNVAIPYVADENRDTLMLVEIMRGSERS